ncbi:HEPN domain-containing protein [Saccharothrix hoggarensis]|uniref:HEPN domain-containing protein n=1 Tax=Saccharothrix hoggarensis TaxID=913853 RepID=A0ABW3QTN8_9PSEU
MSALSDLATSLDQVREIVRLEAGYSDPPGPSELAAVSGLRGAATVLTVASFEAFLRSCFEEQLDRIVKSGIPLSSYSDDLHAGAIFASLELAMKGDHSTRGTEKKDRLPTVLAVTRVISAGAFNPRALSSTESNPDSECVKRMFKTVGRKEIFRHVHPDFEKVWGTPVSGTFCSDKLNALIVSRNQVAHSAQSAHLVRGDLTENVRFVEALATVLSAALSSHVDDLIRDAATV